MNRLKTAFEFSRNKFCASIFALALLLTATIPHATRCRADETAKRAALGKVAQEWMQVGIEQHNRSLFNAAEQSFRRAADYREYLSGTQQRKLDKWSKRANIAAAKSGKPASNPARRSLDTKIKSLTDRVPPKIAPVKSKVPADSVKNGKDLTRKELEFVAHRRATAYSPLRNRGTMQIEPARPSYTRCAFVGGQVSKPGMVQMPKKITVCEAITKVGGFDLQAAESKNVIVIRYTDSRRYAYKLDLAGSKSEAKQFYLQPNDIVHVPRISISRLDQWLDKHINNILPDTGLFVGRTSGSTAVAVGASH